jgi:hypothetical protein
MPLMPGLSVYGGAAVAQLAMLHTLVTGLGVKVG